MLKIFIFILVIICIYLNQNTYIDINNYQSEFIEVEIKGEVNNPGIYKMPYKSAINDLIDKAGGFKQNADDQQINRARILKNQDVVIIKKKNDNKRISLNASSIQELCLLKGIGESTAKKIVDYRNEHGSFQKIEDLMKIKGVKERLFNKIKDLISI